MILSLILSITVIIIIIYLTFCSHVFSCNFSSTVNIRNKLQNLKDINEYCFIGTGEWDGTKCHCKNPNEITNLMETVIRLHIIKNWKILLDLNGEEINFRSTDSLAAGWYCDCIKTNIFNHSLGQCAFSKLKLNVPMKTNVYFYSVKNINLALKNFVRGIYRSPK